MSLLIPEQRVQSPLSLDKMHELNRSQFVTGSQKYREGAVEIFIEDGGRSSWTKKYPGIITGLRQERINPGTVSTVYHRFTLYAS